MSGTSVEKQIEIAKKYGKLSDKDIQKIKDGDEQLVGQLTINLVNAIIHLEVEIADIEDVSNIVPSRFAVTKEQYMKAMIGDFSDLY